MSWLAGLRRMQALFSLVAVLLLFLFASGGVLILRQQRFLHDLERTHAASELQLVGTLARESLIKRDYVTVEQFLHSWGADNPDIAVLEAVGPTGYPLAHYEREGRASRTFEISREISHGGRPLLSIRMVKDLAGVDRQVRRLLYQGAVALAIFAVAMGAALWSTLRRTAIEPMERLVREVGELNEGLEVRVAERTAELVGANEALRLEMQERRHAEESLRRSKEELERQNEELRKLDVLKDALVKDISHELKTPVAKHLMQLEILRDLLRRREGFALVQPMLQVMEQGIRRQRAAIGNVLLISRLEQGGRQPILEPFGLEGLLEEVVNDYLHVIASHGIRLELELGPLTVFSDRELLWHVFGNLVDNAVKYRSRANPRIGIRTGVEDGNALVEVTDNGAGLTREEQSRAFERFYQSTPASEGLGLGLSIVEKILRSLGGSIRIHSEGKDMGTSVFVTLRLAEGAAPAGRTGGEPA